MARKTLWNDEMAGFAKDLCLLGATDQDLAKHFEVSLATINNWKKKHIAFRLAIKAGKFIADSQVAASLFQRAKGWSCEETDIRVIDKKVILTKYTKHYPPDTTAAMYILNNRQKELWRTHQVFEHAGKIATDQLTDAQLAAKERALQDEIGRLSAQAGKLPGKSHEGENLPIDGPGGSDE
jgi:hypothetical protein